MDNAVCSMDNSDEETRSFPSSSHVFITSYKRERAMKQ